MGFIYGIKSNCSRKSAENLSKNILALGSSLHWPTWAPRVLGLHARGSVCHSDRLGEWVDRASGCKFQREQKGPYPYPLQFTKAYKTIYKTGSWGGGG